MPLSLSPEERSQRARIGAFALHSQYDSREISKPGRDAAWARFERQVDPEGVLPPEERARRAEYARKQYFTALAFKSARARKKKAAS